MNFYMRFRAILILLRRKLLYYEGRYLAIILHQMEIGKVKSV